MFRHHDVGLLDRIWENGCDVISLVYMVLVKWETVVLDKGSIEPVSCFDPEYADSTLAVLYLFSEYVFGAFISSIV